VPASLKQASKEASQSIGNAAQTSKRAPNAPLREKGWPVNRILRTHIWPVQCPPGSQSSLSGYHLALFFPLPLGPPPSSTQNIPVPVCLSSSDIICNAGPPPPRFCPEKVDWFQGDDNGEEHAARRLLRVRPVYEKTFDSSHGSRLCFTSVLVICF
jgi:hypothetical protein